MSNSRNIADSAPVINFIDGVTSNVQTQLNAKPDNLSDLGVTASATELNILDGVTATTAEINYSDGVTSNIQTQINNINPAPTFTATASGTLANGDTVIINANGTVSAVLETQGASAIGSATVYENATSRWNNIVYDSYNKKVVIAYRDDGNSNYGTAIVGSVSGTTITFGSPVVFNTNATAMDGNSMAFDSNANKVVIAYRQSNNYGTAIVGTVSGNSISFGTATVWNSATSSNISATFDSNVNRVVIFSQFADNKGYYRVASVSGTSVNFPASSYEFNGGTTLEIASTFDSNSNKVVVFYRDNGNSEYGTARVGTVNGSNNNISWGTEVVFKSNTCNFMDATFDSNSNKIVCMYNNEQNSLRGECVVGTVSGSSISFGASVVFESLNAYSRMSITFNSAYNKIILTWMQNNNFTYTGRVAVGTVSGTSISFATSVTYLNGYSQNQTVAYDANAKASVIVYMDNTNSSYGTASVFQAVTSATNLTTENYIGISNAAYADGAAATVQIVGSVDDAQSGLTAGQQYFVQTDGTLALTEATPSVVAGTAVSATKLIVKG